MKELDQLKMLSESMGRLEEGPSAIDSKVLTELYGIAMTLSSDDRSEEWEGRIHELLNEFGITVPAPGSAEWENWFNS